MAERERPHQYGGEMANSRWVFVYCSLIAAIVLLVDYVMGKTILFPIFYVLPVGLAAWKERRAFAYSLAILLPLARVAFHFPWHETDAPFEIGVNALIRITALILYAYLVSRTARQTRELQTKVQTLEGILPICASCKKIRNEDGAYEQIEKYVSDRSKARFSHGICPECAERLYGVKK